jgi:two-component system KDP operon response regulator KdpE
MTTERILIIDDDKDIRRFVRMALEQDAYRVFEAGDVKMGLVEAGTRQPDLVVLDLGLPDGDGLDLLRDLRSWSKVPVVVLSARDSEYQKVEALDLGADDYLVKPFGVPELLARIRAQLRRRATPQLTEQPEIRFGNIFLDLVTRQVYRNDTLIHLTPTEFKLLLTLVEQPNRVLTHHVLAKAVWGPQAVQQIHYVRVYVQHLRQKLEEDPAHPKFLRTEIGVGYRFVMHVDS